MSKEPYEYTCAGTCDVDESVEVQPVPTAAVLQAGEVKSVSFGGLEFPPSGGYESGARRIH